MFTLYLSLKITMFLKLIKDFFIKKRIKNKMHVFSEKTNKIAILIAVDEIYDIENLKTWLIQDVFINNEVSFLLFDERVSKEKTLNSSYISSKSFGWNAVYKDDLITQFIKNNYQVLISFSNNNLYINHIAQRVQAQYKFGFTSRNNAIFDVSLIGTTFANEEYRTELLKYIKSFNII